MGKILGARVPVSCDRKLQPVYCTMVGLGILWFKPEAIGLLISLVLLKVIITDYGNDIVICLWRCWAVRPTNN